MDENSKPRALLDAPDFGDKSPDDFGETLIARGVLHPALCTAEGVAREMAYVGAVSDAGSDAWAQVGLDSNWLKSNGFGRVSTEMRLCVRSRLKAGEIYTLHVAYTGIGKRSCGMRYDFFDMREGRHVAFLDANVMLFDLKTRRSAVLPDVARAAIEARII